MLVFIQCVRMGNDTGISCYLHELKCYRMLAWLNTILSARNQIRTWFFSSLQLHKNDKASEQWRSHWWCLFVQRCRWNKKQVKRKPKVWRNVTVFNNRILSMFTAQGHSFILTTTTTSYTVTKTTPFCVQLCVFILIQDWLKGQKVTVCPRKTWFVWLVPLNPFCTH